MNIILAVLIFLAACVLLVRLMEKQMIYYPTRFPDGYYDMAGLNPSGVMIRDCYFRTSDGLKLHGWFCSARSRQHSDHGEMVLLWFHGNAGNLSYRLDMVEQLCRLPVGIFIFDYRGYGRSEGNPSEAGIYRDAEGAWNYLTRTEQIPPDRIILFGKSLGSAPAIHLSSRVTPAGLIVQSGFTSVADMARTLIPFIPGFLLKTKMDNLAAIRNIKHPKLFIHSPADEVVPFRLGQTLFEAAPDPKQFLIIQGAPHNETFLVGGEEYYDGIRNFVETCAGGPTMISR